MKHEFKDTLHITVDHEHEIQTDVVEELIDKVVDGAITIIAVATAAQILRRWLT